MLVFFCRFPDAVFVAVLPFLVVHVYKMTLCIEVTCVIYRMTSGVNVKRTNRKQYAVLDTYRLL